MSGRLHGKATIVTGGASGIGRATALAFAREGARVLVSDVTLEPGEETLRELRGLGADAHFQKADVRNDAEVAALVAKAVSLFGRLDCAFNNAGIEGVLATTADYPERAFLDVIEVNLVGVWRCMRAELPALLKTGGGAIVNTASGAGLVGIAGSSAYCAAKHGVVGLTKSTALEYAGANVRVNAVCPGVIHTPMLDRLVAVKPGAAETFATLHPLGRIGTADEVAEAVSWLCSDAASFVTGTTLAVDGGYVAR